MEASNVMDTTAYNLGRLSSDVAHLQGDVREIKDRLVEMVDKIDKFDERHRREFKWLLSGMGMLGLLIIGVVN